MDTMPHQELVLNAELYAARNLAWWLYILHGLSLFFTLGLLSFLPLIVNYIKRSETQGSFVYSHHRWQIRSFWWYLFWAAAGWILYFTIIGIPLAFLTWALVWIWKAYRLIKGWLDLNDNKVMPM